MDAACWACRPERTASRTPAKELDLLMRFEMVLSTTLPRSWIGFAKLAASSKDNVESPLASDVAALMALTTAVFPDARASRSPEEIAVLSDCVADWIAAMLLEMSAAACRLMMAGLLVSKLKATACAMKSDARNFIVA